MAFWLRSLYLITFLVIVSAPIELNIKTLMLAILFASKWLRDRQLGFFSGGQVVRAEIAGSGRAKIKLNDGRNLRAKLRTDSVITPWVILLRFDVRQRWRGPVMVLFKDALEKREMRQLRIFLKFSNFSTR
jgi:hypothetical protein